MGLSLTKMMYDLTSGYCLPGYYNCLHSDDLAQLDVQNLTKSLAHASFDRHDLPRLTQSLNAPDHLESNHHLLPPLLSRIIYYSPYDYQVYAPPVLEPHRRELFFEVASD